MSLSLEQLLHRLGGVASRAVLIELTCRREVDRALREQRIVRVARGRYALPTAGEARRQAARLHGAASHLSAAAHWGWEVKSPPTLPSVSVDRDRKITARQREGVELHWTRFADGDLVDGWVTSPARTFVDCCRDLAFDEALAVADSALRNRTLTRADLLRLGRAARGPGSARCARVAREATDRAANPFESVLRAIALDVPGLDVRPQVLLVDKPFPVRPDLVDDRLRVAIEADSFEWHGSREALRRDCRRYTLLALNGWRVVRFSWEDVMFNAGYVRQVLTSIGARVDRPAQAAGSGSASA